jgi:hypothetical protein
MVSTTATIVATLGAAYVAYHVVNPSSEFSKERILWLSVIKQALMDAEGRGEIEPYRIVRAKRWLTWPLRGFFTVCSLAGLDKQQALRFQENNRREHDLV